MNPISPIPPNTLEVGICADGKEDLDAIAGEMQATSATEIPPPDPLDKALATDCYRKADEWARSEPGTAYGDGEAYDAWKERIAQELQND